MVKLICDSGRDRNMKSSILMFGFMGIPAGYSFSRINEKWLNGKERNGNSVCGEASEFAACIEFACFYSRATEIEEFSSCIARVNRRADPGRLTARGDIP
jgi:hypothetical protein